MAFGTLCNPQVALDKLPDYGDITGEVFVRITDLPIQDSIRDLR